MGYVALYRAYRPQNFSEVCGQEHIVKTLKNAIINNKVAHAYLFAGPRGTGKTSVAKILAKAVNCSNPIDGEPCNECEICKAINKGMLTDVNEIDAASNNGVEEIRDIRDKVKYLPSEGKYKVYIIDEVHMLSVAAFNALLKTLEEPPAHVIFILATTEVHKVLPTILSRCQRFDFRGVGIKEIIERINYVCEQEHVSISEDAVKLIAECSEGGMRDALSLLDEAISYAGELVSMSDVYQVSGSVDFDNLIALANSIYDKDAAKVLSNLEQITDLGKEIPKICSDLIAFYRDILLYKTNPQNKKAIYENDDFQQLTRKLSNNKLYFYLNELNQAQSNMRYTNQKRTYLELSLIKMSDYQEQINIDNSEEIKALEKKIIELEKQIKVSQVASVGALKQEISAPSAEPVKQEEVVVNSEFKLITTAMIQEILNNADSNLRKAVQNKWKTLYSEANKTILAQLQRGSCVACGNRTAIIVFDTNSKCDFMMKKENKVKALQIINADFAYINDYVAVPEANWEVIMNEYLSLYKQGIAHPELTEMVINVRTYEEEEIPEEKDELTDAAEKFFGDDVEFKD